MNIDKVINYCSRKLKIFPPEYSIEKMNRGIAAYDSHKNKILLNTRLFRRLSIKSVGLHEKIINYKFGSFLEYRFFIIAHEFAHYFQSIKYSKWEEKFFKEYDEFQNLYDSFEQNIKTLENYNKLKLEKNANKISLILLKKAKKDKILLDL